MEMLGYVGYGILVLIAIISALGVRFILHLGASTIAAAAFFAAAAISIRVYSFDEINAWWLIPLGYLSIPVFGLALGLKLPLISFGIQLLANMYAALMRIGISSERIREAKMQNNARALNNWMAKRQDKI